MSLRTRIALALAALVALAGAWYVAAPPALGGRTTLLITRGTSMEPRFHTGDLVFLRTRPAYAVGQIVAYHNDELDRTVMHRIIGDAGGRFLFKGDNNDFVDTARPAADELIGTYWFSIPKVGLALGWAADPRHVPFVAGLALLLLVGGGARGAAGRRRRSRRPDVLVPAQWMAASDRSPVAARAAVPAGAGARARAGGAPRARAGRAPPHRSPSPRPSSPSSPWPQRVVAADARGRAETDSVLVPGAYTVDGTFSYAARTSPSAVYPSGRLRTGDPIFVKLVPRIAFSFAYRVTSALPHDLHWKASLDALVSSPQGWQRRLRLVRPRIVHGDSGRLAATVELADVRSVVDRFQELTGVSQSSYTLTLAPTVELAGSVGGAAVQTTFAPQAPFTVDDVQIAVAEPQTLGTGPAPDPLASALAGSVTREEPAAMGLGLGAWSVAATRRDAPVAALAAALLALLAGGLALAARRSLRDGEDARIEREFGDWLIPITTGVVPAGSVIDVESIESLVQIADHYERMLLREPVPGGFVYLVEESGTLYRYSTAPADGTSRSARFPRSGESRVTDPADNGHSSDHAHVEAGELRRTRPVSAL